MNLINDKTIEEQIEILTLIEQQLSVKIKLRSRLRPITGPERLCGFGVLRRAITLASPTTETAETNDLSDLNTQASAVRTALTELKKRRESILKFNQQCETLANALKLAKEYVNQGSAVSGKRSRTLADLDDLSKEASATAETCKRLRTEQSFFDT